MKKDTFFQDTWSAQRNKFAAIKEAGHVMITFGPTRLMVVAPFDIAFNRGAIELGGRWRKRTKRWSFHRVSSRLVVALAEKVFGKVNVTIHKDGRVQ